jgi:hypothetical protein
MAYSVYGMPRREQYQEAAHKIATYLAERQRPDGSFPGPDHYGIAMSLWLWSSFGTEFARPLDRAWSRLQHHPPDTHGEFNAYALLHCQEAMGWGHLAPLLRRLRLDGRHSANWMLLRAVCRLHRGRFYAPVRARLGARAAVAFHRKYGLIEDRPGVRSFGYHAFCGALLADLYDLSGWSWAGRNATAAAAFLAPFVLPNGDALYVGRGQQQIFGYGALLYLLEMAAGITGDYTYAETAERTFARMGRRWRTDGSFPLVLREGAEPEPWHPDASRPGWYSYNCYADYVPFLGCMLLKAAQAQAEQLARPVTALDNKHFRRVEQPRYHAVMSAPDGPATNDLCFPYVCVDEVSLFPCYGREGETPPEEIPLPYGRRADGVFLGFRDQLKYRLIGDGMAGTGPWARHTRRFEFAQDGFTCTDEITFTKPVAWASFTSANFLFRTLRQTGPGRFETWHRHAKAVILAQPDCCIIPRAAVTASGRLVALRQELLAFTAQTGQQVSFRLKVEF